MSTARRRWMWTPLLALLCTARPVFGAELIPLLVPDFVAEQQEDIPNAGAIAARWMRDTLQQSSPHFRIVPEHQWLPRITATGVRIHDPLAPAAAAALHDVSGARFLVQGRLVQWGDRYAIEVRIFALPSGEWRHTGKVWVEDLNDVPDAIGRLTAALFGTEDLPGEFHVDDVPPVTTLVPPPAAAVAPPEPTPALEPAPAPRRLPRGGTKRAPVRTRQTRVPEPADTAPQAARAPTPTRAPAPPVPAPSAVRAYTKPDPVYAPLSPHLVRALVEERYPEMVYVPQGTFTMGTDSREGLQEVDADPARRLPSGVRTALLATERPAHQVSVGAFLIDRFEVTNARFKTFRPAHTYTDGADEHPVTSMSWPDAVAYARSVGKRLPTEAEWEKAARGTDGRRWAWGNVWDAAVAGMGTSTLPVDSSPDGASFYGVYNMGGNVQEWTGSLFAPYPGDTAANPAFDGRHRVVRGSHWAGNSFLARTSARFCALPGERGARLDDPNYAFIGFRCARDVPPLATLYKWLEASQRE